MSQTLTRWVSIAAQMNGSDARPANQEGALDDAVAERGQPDAGSAQHRDDHVRERRPSPVDVSGPGAPETPQRLLHEGMVDHVDRVREDAEPREDRVREERL